MKIYKANDHNLRAQISDALTTLETGAAALGARVTAIEGREEVYAYKSADQTLIGTAYADVTGTGLAVAANAAYRFQFQLIADADATTTGIDVAVNGPAGFVNIQYTQSYWTSATAFTTARASLYDNNTASVTSNGTSQAVFVVEGIFVNGATAGTLIARIKREAVGSGPNVRAGSFGRLRKLS